MPCRHMAVTLMIARMDLRRRIALYEGYLINGVKAQFSRTYPDEIRKAEAELRAIESENCGPQ